MAFAVLLRPDKLMNKAVIATKDRPHESDSVHASPVILQTYASSSTASKCPENNSHSARWRPRHGLKDFLLLQMLDDKVVFVF